jgi:hypothetical protein
MTTPILIGEPIIRAVWVDPHRICRPAPAADLSHFGPFKVHAPKAPSPPRGGLGANVHGVCFTDSGVHRPRSDTALQRPVGTGIRARIAAALKNLRRRERQTTKFETGRPTLPANAARLRLELGLGRNEGYAFYRMADVLLKHLSLCLEEGRS